MRRRRDGRTICRLFLRSHALRRGGSRSSCPGLIRPLLQRLKTRATMMTTTEKRPQKLPNSLVYSRANKSYRQTRASQHRHLHPLLNMGLKLRLGKRTRELRLLRERPTLHLATRPRHPQPLAPPSSPITATRRLRSLISRCQEELASHYDLPFLRKL